MSQGRFADGFSDDRLFDDAFMTTLFPMTSFFDDAFSTTGTIRRQFFRRPSLETPRRQKNRHRMVRRRKNLSSNSPLLEKTRGRINCCRKGVVEKSVVGKTLRLSIFVEVHCYLEQAFGYFEYQSADVRGTECIVFSKL